MLENMWNEIQNANADETLLETVTDEAGYEVRIVRQILTREDGTILDNSILALKPNGILYPEYASKIVLDAIRRQSQK